MSLIVSDTSPIRALAAVGLLNLLPTMYGQIIIPPAVESELARPPAGAALVLSDTCPFIIVRQPSDYVRVRELQKTLDDGEAEAIVLATELHAAILIDEIDGRACATRLGIRVIGVVGILLNAKEASHIKSIKPMLDNLRQEKRFFLFEKVYHHALKSAGE